MLTTMQLLALVQLVSSTALPEQGTNGWYNLFSALSGNGGQLTVFAILALAMSVITAASGPAVLLGGLLCLKNHLRLGKELVGVGATLGFSDLLLRLPILLTGVGPVLWVSWVGLLFTVFGNRHIHGPKATYAGEVRRLWAGVRERLHPKTRRSTARRRRNRRV